MPMDENEKKELVKKIMEQRKALWKGEVKKGRNSEKTSRQIHPEKVEEATTEVDPTAAIPVHDIPVEVTQKDDTHADHSDNKSAMDKDKFSLMTELRKMGELGFRVIFTVICILISALLLGVLIGYGITAVDF